MRKTKKQWIEIDPLFEWFYEEVEDYYEMELRKVGYWDMRNAVLKYMEYEIMMIKDRKTYYDGFEEMFGEATRIMKILLGMLLDMEVYEQYDYEWYGEVY
jgi:hypothetical protein